MNWAEVTKALFYFHFFWFMLGLIMLTPNRKSFDPRGDKCESCKQTRSLNDGLCHECEQMEFKAARAWWYLWRLWNDLPVWRRSLHSGRVSSWKSPFQLLKEINEQIKLEGDNNQRKELIAVRLEFVREMSFTEWLCTCGHSGLSHIPRGVCTHCTNSKINKRCMSFKMGQIVAWPRS